MAAHEEGYSLSLTGAGARIADMRLLARAHAATGDWDATRRRMLEENLLRLNPRSAARIGSELLKRLKTLSAAELAFFCESLDDDAAAMTWLAICRTYPFVRDFACQVLVARHATMLPDVTPAAYAAFAEEQETLHEGLRTATPATKKKLRSTVFTMMRDCRLLGPDGAITPLCPSPAFVRLVREDDPTGLDVFPKAGTLR